MLCDLCHKNIATVHLTEIVNDKILEMHICQACAEVKGQEIKDQLNLSNFLGGLTDSVETQKEGVSLRCPLCGLTYEEFRKRGRLGCANCYDTFRNVILPLLKKIHGSVRHMGKSIFPQEKSSYEARIKDLHQRLERAINLEEYEEAARLRDEIKRLERERRGDS